jgi:hypothetical protein
MGLDISTGNMRWSNSIANDYFSSQISTDGISVFGGTYQRNVVSYSVITGSNYWIYPTGLPSYIQSAPSVASTPNGNFMAFGVSNTIKVIDCSPARSRNNLDITVTLSGIGYLGTGAPNLYTDRGGTIWLYFVSASRLYAAGGFFGSGSTTYIDSSGSRMSGNFWSSFESNVLSTTPVIDGNEAVYVTASASLAGVNTGRIYRYATPPATSRPSVFPSSANYFQWGVESTITTPPIISSQNTLFFNTWDSVTNKNYIFTIST